VVGTTTRTTVGGALLALVGSLFAVPAIADDRGILEHEVPVDMTARFRVFYPAQDDYRDYFQVKLFESPKTDELMRDIDFELTDSAGNVILADRGDPYELAHDGLVYFGWDGRYVERAGLYPEGNYKITATVVDSSNDRKVLTREFRLDHARWRYKAWRRTVSAARSVIDRDVGRCGSLKRPARPGWRGSLGFRTRQCAARGESYAATAHGIFLPKPPPEGYDGVRLNMWGGNARSSRYAPLSYGYLRNDNQWLTGLSYESRVGRHRGHFEGDEYIRGLAPGGRRPHFIWSASIDRGWDYDVKTFTVVAYYREFS
jgi:hypothetical protein